MLIDSKDEEKQGFFDKIEQKIKNWIFLFCNEVLLANVGSLFLFRLFILLEAGQLLYFSLYYKFPFIWKTFYSDYLLIFLRYLQIHFLVEGGDLTVKIIIMYLVSGIQLIMVLLMIFIVYKCVKTKGKSSTFLIYSLRIFGFYSILLTTVAIIPICDILLSVIFCWKQYETANSLQCYSGIYIIHLLSAVLGFLVTLFFLFLFLLLGVDSNPSSTIYLAAPQTRVDLYRLIIKLGMIIYVNIDLDVKMYKAFVPILTCAYIFLLIYRLYLPSYYNKSLYKLQIICDTAVTWITICSFIHSIIDDEAVDDLGLFYMVLGTPFKIVFFLKLHSFRTWFLLSLQQKSIKDELWILFYLLTIWEQIDQIEHPGPRIKIEGLLKFHMRTCRRINEGCSCADVQKESIKEEDSPDFHKRWYFFLRCLIEENIARFPKSSQLHLYHAYLQYDKLRNKFKALYELMLAQENNPGLREEFSIFRYKSLIEEEMKETDVVNTESKGLDVELVVEYQEKYVDFQSALSGSVNMYSEFWRELMEENPDIQKLQILGTKITLTIEKTTQLFKALMNINPNAIRVLELYGNFLESIVNDETEGKRILERADYVSKSSLANKHFVENERTKYGENSNTCVIGCSGNIGIVGRVTIVNSDLNRILGYYKRDILNNNVTKIMPEIFSEVHDGFFKKYLETSESHIIGEERMVFPIHKDEYLVPCTLLLKVLPNLKEGIKIIGFLKEKSAASTLESNDQYSVTHYMIYNTVSGVICGVTKSCEEAFGIPRKLVYGSKNHNINFTIETVIPNYLAEADFTKMNSLSGHIMKLDTTNIPTQFHIPNENESEEYNIDEEDAETPVNEGGLSLKKKKYRKAFIRVHINQELVFENNTKITVIQFVETTENSAVPVIKTDENNFDDPSPLPEGYKNGELRPMKSWNSSRINSARSAIEEDVIEKENKQDAASPVKLEESNKSPKVLKEKNVDDRLINKLRHKRKKHDDIDKSEINSSINDSVNDELRQVKDFKALISEKTVSKSVKTLKRTMLILYASLIVLSSVQLSQFIFEIKDVRLSIYDLDWSFTRENLISTINLEAIQLKLLSRGLVNSSITPYHSESEIKTNINLLTTDLIADQFKITKAEINKDSKIEITEWRNLFQKIFFLLSDNKTIVYNKLFGESIYEYMTQASTLRNATLADLSATEKVNTFTKAYYFVSKNGFDGLRVSASSASDIFLSYAFGLLDEYDIIFRLILILSLVTIVLTTIFLIPIVFSVHKTNNKVLSLFGNIQFGEIKGLITKCDNYLEKFLNEEKDPRDMIYRQNAEERKLNKVVVNDPVSDNKIIELNNEDNSKSHIEINNEDEANKSKFFSKEDDKSPLRGRAAGNSDNKNSKADDKVASFQNSLNRMSINKGSKGKKDLEQLKKEEQEKLEDFQYIRTQKLMNSKDNSRNVVVVQFLIMGSFLVGYFLAAFLLQQDFLKNTRSVIGHQIILEERPMSIKYCVLFTLQEIQSGEPYLYEGSDLKSHYTDLVFNNSANLLDSTRGSFPKQLENYMSALMTFNDDLCQNFFKTSALPFAKDCATIANGVLTKGLRTSVVSLVGFTKDALNNFQHTEKTEEVKKAALAGDLMKWTMDLLKFLIPTMDRLNNLLIECFDSYFDFYGLVQKLSYSIFIIFLFFMYLIAWLPFLSKLNNKMWKTRGMLNMIPMDVISKNENLKWAFLSGEILQAVK